MHCPATQDSPAAQQEHPHATLLAPQVSVTQTPKSQIWPQRQAGLHSFAEQTPFVHLPPPAQPHVPPQPSPPPQVPSVGQCGLQQLPP